MGTECQAVTCKGKHWWTGCKLADFSRCNIGQPLQVQSDTRTEHRAIIVVFPLTQQLDTSNGPVTSVYPGLHPASRHTQQRHAIRHAVQVCLESPARRPDSRHRHTSTTSEHRVQQHVMHYMSYISAEKNMLYSVCYCSPSAETGVQKSTGSVQ